jgi:ribose-phosphate pyrophosphokinase
MKRKIKIFALSSSKELAQAVANNLNEQLGQVEITHFADGEIMVRSLESVRDANVYIIQSTCPPVTEHLFELLIFVDSLKRASAHEINVIIPYFGYARQDRMARPREPITAKLVADMLITAGIRRIITIDIHTLQIQGFFTVPFEILSVLPLFGHHLRLQLEKLKIAFEDVVIVSPDHGSALRARDLATLVPGSSLALVDKRRTGPNVTEVSTLIGDVKDKTIVIIDDIIDTAGTIINAGQLLKDKQAKLIYACATHGIFSGNALTNLNKSPIDRLFITDTIPSKSHPLIQVISVADMLSSVINNIELELPLEPIYDVYNL